MNADGIFVQKRQQAGCAGRSGRYVRRAPFTAVIALALIASGCVFVPQHPDYSGPAVRPANLDKYYDVGNSYTDYVEEVLLENEDYTLRRFDINTTHGTIVVDFLQRHKKSDDLIFVLPVLGGRNIFANYMADYFTRQGFDTAVVHRDSDFKDPKNYRRLEELFRGNVIKDRIAIDFFEREFGKKDFGTFGISRGAINAAISAGVDSRLKYNVLAFGGADLINLFKDSKEKGIKKYRRRVMDAYSLSEQQFYDFIERTVITEPKLLAQYIDARDTLMFLSLLDESVPIKYGLKLRRRIGLPETVFLVSGHYTALLYTQFLKIALPVEDFCLFPLDYIETESLEFYRENFQAQRTSYRQVIYSVIQTPILLVAKIANAIW